MITDLDGQEVKLAAFCGEFIWHRHHEEDEMFLVHKGQFRLERRDHVIGPRIGDVIAVPRGFEHRPDADEEAKVVLFEPLGTWNTGNVGDPRRSHDVRL